VFDSRRPCIEASQHEEVRLKSEEVRRAGGGFPPSIWVVLAAVAASGYTCGGRTRSKGRMSQRNWIIVGAVVVVLLLVFFFSGSGEPEVAEPPATDAPAAVEEAPAEDAEPAE
jgi:hypothetical protein